VRAVLPSRWGTHTTGAVAAPRARTGARSAVVRADLPARWGWWSSARAVGAGQCPLRADPDPVLARPGTTGRTRASARGRASPGLRELLRPGPRGTASRGDRPVDEGEVRAALRVGRSDPGSSRSRALRTAWEV